MFRDHVLSVNDPRMLSTVWFDIFNFDLDAAAMQRGIEDLTLYFMTFKTGRNIPCAKEYSNSFEGHLFDGNRGQNPNMLFLGPLLNRIKCSAHAKS